MQWPPTRPGSNFWKFHLVRGRRQHVAGVDAELMEDRRQLVHEGDIEIALGILDDLGGLGDLDRGRAVNAGLDHRAVDVGDDIERARVLRRRPPW